MHLGASMYMGEGDAFHDVPRESWADLGWVFSGLALLHMARSEEPLDGVRRGLATEAPFANAFVGARVARTAARAIVRMGHLDEALEVLEAVRTAPVTLSIHDLRNDPEWDPLRDHLPFPAVRPGGVLR